jgi:hypothetical protein
MYNQFQGKHYWSTAGTSTAGNAITFTQAMTLNASGNLSIGNTNNTYKLDVTGTARFTGQVDSETKFYVVATPPATNGGLINVRDTVTATNVTSFAGVFFNSAPGSDYSIGKLTENNAGFLQIRNANTSSELLRISSTGAATFSSSVTATGLFIGTSNGPVGDINSTNANGGYLTWSTSGTVIADLGTAQQIFGSGGNDTFGINGRGARALTFGTNNAERLRITSGGQVLIGSTTSLYTDTNRGVLEVNGSSSAIVGLTIGGTNGGYLLHSGTNLSVWNAKNGAQLFATNNTERMRITSGGNVSIGNTNDTYKLDVNGGNSLHILNLESTWNSSLTTGYGINLNITDTASAAGSYLLRLAVGGNQYFSVDKSGKVYMVLPTSSTGLGSGQLWNDNGTVKIV